MRTYQLVLVLKTSLSDSERKKLLDLVKSWLKDAKIVKEEEWGQKPLSYKIKRETEGFYLNYWLESEASIPLDFEKKLFAQEDVLRHLLIRSKEKVPFVAKALEGKQISKTEEKPKAEVKKEVKPKAVKEKVVKVAKKTKKAKK